MPKETTYIENPVKAERTIAIVGARGRLGRVVAEAFAKSDWRVVAITRDGKPPTGPAVGSNLEYRAADALDAEALSRACTGCGFVFNALNPPYTQWHTDALPMARSVLKAVTDNDAVHLFPGNVYNFGSQLPAILSEDTPQAADHPKAAIRARIEQTFEDAARQGKARTFIIRAGDYFGGTGTGSWFDQVISAKATRGKFSYPGPLDATHAWAYLPDLAQAVVRMAESSDHLDDFKVFHFEGHSMTGAELKHAMERVLDRPLKQAGLPWFIIRMGGLVVPMWREISQIAYLWQRPHRLSGDKLAAAIGKVPHTPLETAVAAALGDLGIIAQPSAHAQVNAMPTLVA